MTPQEKAMRKYKAEHHKLQIWLDKKEVALLDSVAGLHDISRSELLRKIIKNYCAQFAAE